MEVDIDNMWNDFKQILAENTKGEIPCPDSITSLEFNDTCYDCGGVDIVVLSGEVICRTCGSPPRCRRRCWSCSRLARDPH